MNLHSPPETDWPAPPLISGEWRTLDPGQTMRVMIRLCAESDEARTICQNHDIAAARSRPLVSIRDGLLVEFLARPHAEGQPRIGAFVYRPGLIDLLDGASTRLHQINDDDGTILESAEQALEYTLLFSAAIQGVEGSFFPALPGFPVVQHEADPASARSLEVLAEPPQVKKDPRGWRVELTVSYGTQMFRTEMLLQRNGMVEMLDDRHLCGLAPRTIEGWADNLRTQSPLPADWSPPVPCFCAAAVGDGGDEADETGRPAKVEDDEAPV